MGEDMMVWLNGRLVSDIVIIHNRKKHTIWTLKDGQGGMTIEDAIYDFCKLHQIDMQKEIDIG